jgi:SAM-dependent methyltransferase/predicted alpha/beta hydrolase family esterase
LKTFVLIHGAGDGGWAWHLVEAELRRRGHDVVTPDLPADDDSFTLDNYADAVVAAVGDRRDLVVVAHSFGGFTAPLVAVRLPVDALIYVAAMVPAPKEAPEDWWHNTGYRRAKDEQAARDGGLTGNDDPYVSFYHDVPRDLAERALGKARAHPSKASSETTWPLQSLPNVPTHFILCTQDRFFPPDFLWRVVARRLGIVPDEIAAGHCAALSRPHELVDILEGYTQALRPRLRLADHYDVELHAYDERLRDALQVGPHDRVLDVGCGTGQTTCNAARAAALGTAWGVDISEAMIERARRRSKDAVITNISFEQGDAQSHPFSEGFFDLIASRFGTMFFREPIAAFTNLAHAARPNGRLVMLVWQDEERNEWAASIRQIIGEDVGGEPKPGTDPFSMADPDVIRSILGTSGFADIEISDVHERVYYGPYAAAALDLVRDMSDVRNAIAHMSAESAERTLARLRDLLAAHETGEGVSFDSRAWLVTARRAGS